MTRITKGMIAAANAELQCIHELATEAQQIDGTGTATYRYHADSGSRHLNTIVKAGLEIPEWVCKNQKYLTAHNWRIPYRAACH
jgi:hypothetical protein